MTFPSKLSEAGQQQLAKQIDFFQALTTRAFENAERILALNMQATRAALDQTSGVVRQLAEVRDPRDLLGLTRQTQAQVDAAMVYSRKLFEITSQPALAPAVAAPASAAVSDAASESAPAPSSAPEQHIVTAAPVMVSEPVVQTTVAQSDLAPAMVDQPAAPVTVSATLDEPAEPASTTASAILPSKHPMGEAEPVPEPAITAKTRPIARAAGKVAAAPVDTPHPVASPIPEAGRITIPAIPVIPALPPVPSITATASVDAAAAPAQTVAPAQPKRSGSSASKGGRKR